MLESLGLSGFLSRHLYIFGRCEGVELLLLSWSWFLFSPRGVIGSFGSGPVGILDCTSGCEVAPKLGMSGYILRMRDNSSMSLSKN